MISHRSAPLVLILTVVCCIGSANSQQAFLRKTTLAIDEKSLLHVGSRAWSSQPDHLKAAANQSAEPSSSQLANQSNSQKSNQSASQSPMTELLAQLSHTAGLTPAVGDAACTSPDNDACLVRLLVLARSAAKARHLIPLPGWPGPSREHAIPGERKWIDRFLIASASLLTTGRCLEFGDLTYTQTHFASQCWHRHYTRYTGKNAPPAGMTQSFEVDIDYGPGPIPINSFDTIIATMVFEHVKDPSTSASTLFQVLKPGGIMLWTVPTSWPHHVAPGFGDYWRYTEEGGRLLLQRAGFEIMDSECHGDSSTVALYAMGMGEEEMIAKETYSGDCNYGVNVGIRARKPLH